MIYQTFASHVNVRLGHVRHILVSPNNDTF